jgi:hypothetical protein
MLTDNTIFSRFLSACEILRQVLFMDCSPSSTVLLPLRTNRNHRWFPGTRAGRIST